MVKLEFENPPPTREALEQSQQAAVERVTKKKRKSKSSSQTPAGDGSFDTLPVSESDPTKAVSTIQTPSQPSEPSIQDIQQQQFLKERSQREEQIKQQLPPIRVPIIPVERRDEEALKTFVEQEIDRRETFAREKAQGEFFKDSFIDKGDLLSGQSILPEFKEITFEDVLFEKQPQVSPDVIPIPTETTRTDLADPLSVESFGFKPSLPADFLTVQPATTPRTKFEKKREELEFRFGKDTGDQSSLLISETPAAVAVAGLNVAEQSKEFLRGAVADPIKAIITPVESIVRPLAETTAALVTGETTPTIIAQEIQKSFVDEPARFAGNVAFDIVSGKLLSKTSTSAVAELAESRRAREFKSLVTDPEFKLPPPKTQVLSQLEAPEGLTSRGRLITVADEFSEGLLPVLDESTGTVKELQSQLIADPNVKVTAEALPVQGVEGIKDTGFILQKQTKLIEGLDYTVGMDKFRDLFDAKKSPLGSVELTDDFVVTPKDTQLPLDTLFDRPKARIDLSPEIKIETVSPDTKLRSFPDPVSALFQTAVDPEFLSFTSKEFERLKKGAGKLQADVELPSTPVRKQPTFEYPISAQSLIVDDSTSQFPPAIGDLEPISQVTSVTSLEQKPSVSLLEAQATGLTPANIQILSVTPITDTVVDTRPRSKSSTRQTQETILDNVVEQDTRPLIVDPVMQPLQPKLRTVQALRQQPSVVPKPRLRPKQKVQTQQSRFTLIIGTKGAKTFKTIQASSLLEATRIGKRSLLGTAAASLEIRPVGRGLRVEEEEFIEDFLGRQFRRSKTTKKKFVQKREFRISSPGEKQEITFRGLASLQTKKGSKKAIDLMSRGVSLRDIRKLL